MQCPSLIKLARFTVAILFCIFIPSLGAQTFDAQTIERTLARDAGGQKILTRVGQEEKQSLPAGDENVLRTTSNTALDGRLHVAPKEVRS